LIGYKNHFSLISLHETCMFFKTTPIKLMIKYDKMKHQFVMFASQYVVTCSDREQIRSWLYAYKHQLRKFRCAIRSITNALFYMSAGLIFQSLTFLSAHKFYNYFDNSTNLNLCPRYAFKMRKGRLGTKNMAYAALISRDLLGSVFRPARHLGFC
jgi:hypothetical protein